MWTGLLIGRDLKFDIYSDSNKRPREMLRRGANSSDLYFQEFFGNSVVKVGVGLDQRVMGKTRDRFGAVTGWYCDEWDREEGRQLNLQDASQAFGL